MHAFTRLTLWQKAVLPQQDKELKKYQTQSEAAQGLKKLQREQNAIILPFLWAVVADHEQTLAATKEKRDALDERADKFQQKLEAATDGSAADAKRETLVAEQGEISNRSKQLARDKAALDKQIKAERQKIKSILEQRKGAERELRRREATQKTLRQKMAKLRGVLSKDQGKDEAKRQNAIKALRSQLKKARDDYEALQEKLQSDGAGDGEGGGPSQSQQQSGRDLLGQRKRDTFAQLQRTKMFIRENEGKIKQAQQIKQSNLRLWGVHTDAIVKEIGRQKAKFERVPVGPIGNFVSLKGAHAGWIKAVEALFKPDNLSSYIVHSQRDYKILDGIINAQYGRGWRGRKPAVIRYSFDHASFADKLPKAPSLGAQSVCLYDLVEWENDTVHNVMVEKTNPHGWVCMPTAQRGQAYDALREKAGRTLRGVVLDKGQIIKYGRTGQTTEQPYFNPNHSMIKISKSSNRGGGGGGGGGGSNANSSAAKAVEKYKADIAELGREVVKLEAEVKKIEAALSRAAKHTVRLAEAQDNYDRTRKRLEEALDKLEGQVSSFIHTILIDNLTSTLIT